MSKKLIPLVIGGVLIASSASPAFAALTDFQFNGFASVGGAMTDAPHHSAQTFGKTSLTNNYLAIDGLAYPASNAPPVDSRINLRGLESKFTASQDTLIGLQLSKNLTDKLSFTGQFVASGALADYPMQASWLFGKYQINDNWAARAGQFRGPAYMLSDYLDVRYAQPWVRPPMEVYSTVPFDNIAGVDLNYQGSLFGYDLMVQGFYGETDHSLSIENQAIDLKQRDTRGVNLTYGNEVFTMRLIYADTRATFSPQINAFGNLRDFLAQSYGYLLSLNSYLNAGGTAVITDAGTIAASLSHPISCGQNIATGAITPCTPSSYAAGLALVETRVPASYWELDSTYGSFGGLGYKFDWNNIYSLGEMVKRKITGFEFDELAGYVTLGYRFGNVMPHLTYSMQKTLDKRERRLQTTRGLDVASLQAANFATSYAVLNSTAAGQAAIAGINQFAEEALGAAIDSDQSSWTMGVRYDAFDSTAFKAEWQNVKAHNGTSGLFSANPGRRVNVFSLAMDVVF